jgi:putative transposase
MRNAHLFRKEHCVFRLTFHAIFVTKFRRHCLSPEIRAFLFSSIPRIARSVKVKVLEINGEADHVHFLLEIAPTDRLSNILGILKCRTACEIHDNFDLSKYYYGRHRRTLWSSGYFVVSTGGAPLDTVKKYIQNQNHR